MAATRAELNRYFEIVNRRVPTRVSEFIRWLRKPSSFAARLAIALMLILALQLSSFLEVRALSGGLVSSAPERPCNDICGLDSLSSEFDGDAADFLD